MFRQQGLFISTTDRESGSHMKTVAVIIACISLTLTAQTMSFEDSLAAEINLVRSNPSEYAQKYLEPYLNSPDWGVYTFPNGDQSEYKGRDEQGRYQIQVEGKSAVEECIAFLKKQSPASTVTVSRGMCLGAQDHVLDQGSRGLVGHRGTDGSKAKDRIKRYVTTTRTVRVGNTSQTTVYGAGENIDYGNSSPRDIVLSLLIDDGVPSRGHRANILKKQYEFIGVARGYHKTYGVMCVITFTEWCQELK